jgi:D-sedoheptulose 7-phosphate isomerase
MRFSVKNYLEEHQNQISKLNLASIEAAINLIKSTVGRGGKIITCGNGGSAATASHYITDWNKMFNLASGKKFLGFSLVDNIGLLTAYANDISFDEVFVGQLKAILEPLDLLVCVSGSGNSKNVVNATVYANSIGAETLAIVGYDGGALKKLSKYAVHVKSFDMQICEDFHLMFGHLVMKSLCGGDIHVE